jgi:GntR family transcriptional regulator
MVKIASPRTQVDIGSSEIETYSSSSVADKARQLLLEMIRSGALRPGQRLGDERALSADIGVSRSTLRQALAVLEDDGIIKRVSGRGGGTFIAHVKINRDMSQVVGVPALLRSQGVVGRARVLIAGLVTADEATVNALDLPLGSLVYAVVRLRLADGEPIAIENAKLPAARFADLLEQPMGGSLYELLEERYQAVVHEAVEQIETVLATAGQALLLEIKPGEPLLSIMRTTTDAEGRPFEYSHDLFRGDRTRITVRSPGAELPSPTARRRGRPSVPARR